MTGRMLLHAWHAMGSSRSSWSNSRWVRVRQGLSGIPEIYIGCPGGAGAQSVQMCPAGDRNVKTTRLMRFEMEGEWVDKEPTTWCRHGRSENIWSTSETRSQAEAVENNHWSMNGGGFRESNGITYVLHEERGCTTFTSLLCNLHPHPRPILLVAKMGALAVHWRGTHVGRHENASLLQLSLKSDAFTIDDWGVRKRRASKLPYGALELVREDVCRASLLKCERAYSILVLTLR